MSQSRLESNIWIDGFVSNINKADNGKPLPRRCLECWEISAEALRQIRKFSYSVAKMWQLPEAQLMAANLEPFLLDAFCEISSQQQCRCNDLFVFRIDLFQWNNKQVQFMPNAAAIRELAVQ